MAYDQNRRFYRPDFQAQLQPVELPQWQQMGGEDQSQQMGQAAGSFADLLKKRMGAGKSSAGASPTAMHEGLHSGGGEGMQSL